TINGYYQSVITKLPKDGRVVEVSSVMLVSVEGLAALFCKELVLQHQDVASDDNQPILKEMSHRIYGRDLTETENQKMTELLDSVRDHSNRWFWACTAMASSPEFLLQ